MEWEPNVSTMWDFYQLYWAPFGELLTDMERAGIYINKEHLNSMLPKVGFLVCCSGNSNHLFGLGIF